MTVLSVIQSAATVIGLEVPSVVFSATSREMVEIQRLVNNSARQILEEYDWQRLKKIATITGDGSDEDFALPTDYDRMVKDATLWSSESVFDNLIHVLSSDEWLMLDTQSMMVVGPFWTIYGDQIHIKPARANGELVKYFYVSNYVVKSTGSSVGDKTAFTADDDSFVLDERLLTLNVIWNWKKAKGQDYTAELTDYQEAMSYAVGKDKGSRKIIVGRAPSWDGVNPTYPYGPLGVP